MQKRTLVVLSIVGLVVAAFWIGQGVADQSVELGDIAGVADCLGVEPREGGVYYVSDILCELAQRLGAECSCECPDPPVAPAPGDVIIACVIANASGSPEIPNERIFLTNVSDCTVDLAGCVIGDENDSWTIPSGHSEAILGPGEEAEFSGRDYNPTNKTQGIALRNGGETVFVSYAGYKDSWQYPGNSDDDEMLCR
ncbi:hypothetical protein ACFLSF_04690 [Candidatus Bipolaricaulota bacterium]